MTIRHRRAATIAWLACAAFGATLSPATAAAPGYATAGLTAAQLARLPGVSYARPLMELPERNLVVLHLSFPPRGSSACHRHAGPATIRVTRGALRLGIHGQPARVVRAGEVFYEPANSLHMVAENPSGTEPASAVALLVLPKGAPILTPEKNCGVAQKR